MNDLLQRLRERIAHAKAMGHTYTAQVMQEALDTLLEIYDKENNA